MLARSRRSLWCLRRLPFSLIISCFIVGPAAVLSSFCFPYGEVCFPFPCVFCLIIVSVALLLIDSLALIIGPRMSSMSMYTCVVRYIVTHLPFTSSLLIVYSTAMVLLLYSPLYSLLFCSFSVVGFRRRLFLRLMGLLLSPGGGKRRGALLPLPSPLTPHPSLLGPNHLTSPLRYRCPDLSRSVCCCRCFCVCARFVVSYDSACGVCLYVLLSRLARCSAVVVFSLRGAYTVRWSPPRASYDTQIHITCRYQCHSRRVPAISYPPPFLFLCSAEPHLSPF